MSTSRKWWWHVAALFAIAFVVYGSSLGHDFIFNWDDGEYVFNNPLIRGFTPDHIVRAFSEVLLCNYAPVHVVSYMVDYAFWGMRPAGFIFGNIVLHAANGILLSVLIMSLGFSRRSAFIASILFLVHPVQVESVAWISERKNVLSLFLVLLAWNLYNRYAAAEVRHRALFYAGSLAAFILALLTKAVTVVLPVMLLVQDICIERPGRMRDRIADKIPYLISAAAAGTAVVVIMSPENAGGRVGFHGGSALATALTMLTVLVRYAGMIVWPAELSAYYAPVVRTSVDSEVLLGLAFLVLFIGAGFYLFRTDRRAFLWYAVIPLGLLPVMQIIPIVHLMNDRYLYVPMIGIAALVGIASDAALNLGSWRKGIAVVCIVALLGGYAYAAQRRTAVWQNAMTLWSDAVQKEPGSYVAWFMLANVYAKEGRVPDAIRALERSVALGGVRRVPLIKLGQLYRANGDEAGLRRVVDAGLSKYPDDPELLELAGRKRATTPP